MGCSGQRELRGDDDVAGPQEGQQPGAFGPLGNLDGGEEPPVGLVGSIAGTLDKHGSGGG